MRQWVWQKDLHRHLGVCDHLALLKDALTYAFCFPVELRRFLFSLHDSLDSCLFRQECVQAQVSLRPRSITRTLNQVLDRNYSFIFFAVLQQRLGLHQVCDIDISLSFRLLNQILAVGSSVLLLVITAEGIWTRDQVELEQIETSHDPQVFFLGTWLQTCFTRFNHVLNHFQTLLVFLFIFWSWLGAPHRHYVVKENNSFPELVLLDLLDLAASGDEFDSLVHFAKLEVAHSKLE